MKTKTQLEKLARSGISQADIAKIQHVNPATISKRMKKYDLEKQRLVQFNENKANEFEFDQMQAVDIQRDIREGWSKEVLSGMTENERRALHHTLTVDIGVKEDKIRNIRGQSTSITTHKEELLVLARFEQVLEIVDKRENTDNRLDIPSPDNPMTIDTIEDAETKDKE